MDVDALSREMAINAKAIQQQAMKDPTKLVMRTQAEQITDEQHEQAQKITDEAMRKAASVQTTQQIGKVFGNMKQGDLAAVLGADKVSSSDKDKAAALGNGMMFLSMSLPDKDLMASLEVAARYSMPVAFIGLLKGSGTITDTARQLRVIARKAGISEATFYNWRKKYAGLVPSEMKPHGVITPGAKLAQGVA